MSGSGEERTFALQAGKPRPILTGLCQDRGQSYYLTSFTLSSVYKTKWIEVPGERLMERDGLCAQASAVGSLGTVAQPVSGEAIL